MRPKIRSRIGRVIGPFPGRNAGRIREGRRDAFRALAPSPTPCGLQHGEHPQVSRSRPRNDETEGVSGKLWVPLNSNGVGEGERTLIYGVVMKEGLQME